MASPACPAEHVLQQKVVAGSWFKSCKKCSGCDAPLKGGTVRHSCRECNYHLCSSCHAAVGEALTWSDITITVYRAAQGSIDEDTFQVQIERGASVGALKGRVNDLYGIPQQVQVLRRSADGEPLADVEPLACDEGDVLCLEVRRAMDPLFGGNLGSVLGPLAGLTDALAGAMASAQQERLAQQQALERAEYALTFVMPASAASPQAPEGRCSLEVAATALAGEVLDMVKLELGVEDQPLALEFAGEELRPAMTIHAAGLRAGDTVMVMPVSVGRGQIPASGGNPLAAADHPIVSM